MDGAVGDMPEKTMNLIGHIRLNGSSGKGSTWFLQANKADEIDREGMVRVPKSQRDLSAYERVRREDVIDLDGQWVKTMYEMDLQWKVKLL